MRALALALGKLRRFNASRDGNVMILFGIGAIMLFCCAGIGIDMARAYAVRLRLNAATDAAGLAVAAMSSNTSQAQQQAQLQNFFNANFPQGQLGNADGFAPAIVPTMAVSGQTITVSASTTVRTLFMQVFPGLQNVMSVGASSIIKKGTGLELALALDNTGSMFASTGGVSNISALRSDTVTLINTLFSQTTNQSQLFISIVPFVTTVNLPPQLVGVVANQANPFTGDAVLAYDATQTDDTKWKGCPLENKYPNDINPTQQTWPGQYLWGTFNYQTADASLNATTVGANNIAKVNQNNSDNVLTSPPRPAPPTSTGPAWNVPAVDQNKVTVSPNTAGKTAPFITAGIAPLPSSAPTLWSSTTTTNKTGFDGNSDTVPLSTTHTNFFTASDNSDCNYNAAKNKDCPTQITPLTNNQQTLLNAANAMQAWCQSGTMIHIGLAWGWRTIEPNGIFNTLTNAPHDYNDTNWLKALVLMTDGQDVLFQGCDQTYSYNSGAYVAPPGSANNTANPNGGGISPTAAIGAPYTNYYGPNIDLKVGGSTTAVATEGQAASCLRGGNAGQNAVFYPPLSGMTPYGRVGDPGMLIGVGVPDPTNGNVPSANGATTTSNGKALLDEEVAEACVALKEDGVRVYTIAFTGAAANSITMLQACASDPNKTFFNAPTQADLAAAFTTIAQDLNKIRVAQ
jgi:Flp pilus assembly protein TadG